MQKRVVMCSPDYFDVVYSINPWMKLDDKVDTNLAKKQHQALKELYLKLGVEVWDLPPKEGLPDMVFSANPGTPDGNNFVVSHFKHDERKLEAAAAEAFFREKGFDIHPLPERVYFEGQGDLIVVGKKYFMGYGKRSSLESVQMVSEAIGKPITPLKMHDPYLYHLDICLGPLNEEVAVINPHSFTPEDLKVVKKSFSKIIETNEQDNSVMACNLVVIDKHVVISQGISPTLHHAIEKEGFEVHEMNTSEFLKAGGGVKCMTMELW